MPWLFLCHKWKSYIQKMLTYSGKSSWLQFSLHSLPMRSTLSWTEAGWQKMLTLRAADRSNRLNAAMYLEKGKRKSIYYAFPPSKDISETLYWDLYFFCVWTYLIEWMVMAWYRVRVSESVSMCGGVSESVSEWVTQYEWMNVWIKYSKWVSVR